MTLRRSESVNLFVPRLPEATEIQSDNLALFWNKEKSSHGLDNIPGNQQAAKSARRQQPTARTFSPERSQARGCSPQAIAPSFVGAMNT